MSTCDTHVTESGTLAFRVALSVLRHREDAEDVAQEAVVRSLQRFDSLKDRTRFRAWLVRIAWRLALDRRRSDTRRAARDFRSIQSDRHEGSAEHQAIERERTAQLWAAIDQLPARLRLPLVLGTLQGRTVEEVSSLLDVPVGTVKSRMFEARRKLKLTLVGTGVSICLVGLLLGTLLNPHLQIPDVVPIARSLAPVATNPTDLPGPVRSLTASSQAPALRLVPVATESSIEAATPEASVTEIPVVTVATMAVKTVKLPVVPVPVIQLPVVSVTSVKVPTLKRVLVWASETHQEK